MEDNNFNVKKFFEYIFFFPFVLFVCFCRNAKTITDEEKKKRGYFLLSFFFSCYSFRNFQIDIPKTIFFTSFFFFPLHFIFYTVLLKLFVSFIYLFSAAFFLHNFCFEFYLSSNKNKKKKKRKKKPKKLKISIAINC